MDQFSPYPLFYPFIMSDGERAIFDQAIKTSRHYLEFGLGGSTLRALQKSKAKIYTVESSPEWIDSMRKYVVVRFSQNRRLFIFPVHIGPLRGWGYPASKDFKQFFEKYSSSVFESIDGVPIDLVLVDGRFRVACALKTILAYHENRGIKIMIHDFWNRPHYHIVLQYLEPIERADTLGMFSIKKNLELQSVARDYEAYKFNPD